MDGVAPPTPSARARPGLVTAITGPLFFFVPGPNIVSWYFTFRTVGHFLSWRGALRGLTQISWTPQARAPLSAVRAALALGQAERCARLDAISSELGLAHLTGFVERLREREKCRIPGDILAAP